MAAPSLAPGLARKVKKTLEMRTESPEILGSLATLSSFYEDNTPAARRQLCATIEKQGLSITQQYLQSAEHVVQALDAVQCSLDGLTSGCRAANKAVASSDTSTANMLAVKEKLQQALATREQRGLLVHKFLSRYQLSAAEVAALQAERITDDFFAALERVRTIHANCRSLLRSHHQRAGLELMEIMSNHQEAAYERLCRWVQGECRGLGDMDAPEVNPLLQRAAQALREREVLFRYCAEEVAQARHNALFQRFIAALTRGGPGGMPRPIEMHAHNPRRYIGDMLAWVHQSLASERELLMALFGDRRPTEEGSGEMPSTAVLLDKVFQSICRPLKVRIEQVLLGSPQLLLCFTVSQLLAFYGTTVDRLLGSEGQLTEVLVSCHQLAKRVFHEQLKRRGDQLVRSPPAPPKDLSPPQQLKGQGTRACALRHRPQPDLFPPCSTCGMGDALHQMQELATFFESAFDTNSGHTLAEEFEPVLGAVVDPLVQMCERSAEALNQKAASRVDEASKMDPDAHHIYLLNCGAAIETVLMGHACCATRRQQLTALLTRQIDALVHGQVSRALAACNFAEIVERIREYEAGSAEDVAKMAADPQLQLPALSEAMQAFFSFLSGDPLPELRGLQVPRLKSEVLNRIAQSLFDCYSLVYSAITAPEHGYRQHPQYASATRHTPTHVQTILGIQ